MTFSKTLTLILREYLVIVKKPSFILMTMLIPIGYAALLAWQVYVGRKETKQTFEVIDRSGSHVAVMLSWERNKLALLGLQEPYEIKRIADTEEAKKSALDRVKAGKLDALLIIPENVLADGKVEFHAKRVTDFRLHDWLRNTLSKIAMDQRLKDRGLSSKDIDKVTARVGLNIVDVSGRKDSVVQRTIIGFVSMFVLYMMIAIYGGIIMSGFVEDKNSRVLEVLLSVVRPRQILFGKVVGVGLTSLTQVVIWGIALVAALKVKPDLIPVPLSAPWQMVGFTLVFFLLGYFAYALILGSLGALCETLQDAQQFSFAIYLPLIIALVSMTGIVRQPDGGLALVLSLFPLTSPVVMPGLMGVADVASWQVWTSLALLVAYLYAAFRFSGKMFRIALLTQGKTPGWKQIWKLLTAKEA